MSKEPKIDRQREHQANERTFLAWLRTSIALIGFGFAIARFGIFLRQIHLTMTHQEPPTRILSGSEALGVSLVILGIVAIAWAAWHYNQIFWQIERGNYQPHRFMIFAIASVVAILGSLSIPLLLWRDRNPNTPPNPKPSNPSNLLSSGKR
jgi:putative membrane protein